MWILNLLSHGNNIKSLWVLFWIFWEIFQVMGEGQPWTIYSLLKIDARYLNWLKFLKMR
jgi:hypothetical protein